MCTVMHIPPDIAFWLQRNLAIICEDDVSIAYVSSGVIASIPDRTEARWQLSVDMLYRLIKCELISVLNFADCTDIPSFFSEIQSHGPDFDDQGAYVWMAIQIYGTDKLEVLMKSHFGELSRAWDALNPVFINALERVFADNGVPWSEKPLLPITPAGAESAPPV